MSYFDYQMGKQIAMQDYPFYALIQAAMRQADTFNKQKLVTAFPDVWDELQTRYYRPEGRLEGEP